MNRGAYIERLRRGLAGLPESARADILADYEAHFADGAAAGRTEEEVAQSLGDPDRLARELRAAYGLRAWDETRNPSGALNAVLALLGLGALDVLIVGPLLVSFASVILAFAIAAALVFLVGVFVAIFGTVSGLPGGPAAAVLLGVGVCSAGVCLGALTGIGAIAFVNGAVWYARMHLKLLRPALSPDLQGALS